MTTPPHATKALVLPGGGTAGGAWMLGLIERLTRQRRSSLARSTRQDRQLAAWLLSDIASFVNGAIISAHWRQFAP
jgi:hypothetical protein